MRNLLNFNVSSNKPENLHFDVVLLLSITYKVSAQKKYPHDTKKRSNFEEKLTFCLKKMT